MLTTVFLLGLLYAVFVTALVLVHVAARPHPRHRLRHPCFVQYFFSDKIALYSMGGKIVTREQAPQLHGVVDRLVRDGEHAQAAASRSRKVDMPNAFATGRDQKHAVVCVTTGLLRRLDEPEVEAVLAHELSHVAHRDVAVMTIASFLGILAGLLTRVLSTAGPLRRLRRRRQQGPERWQERRWPVGHHRARDAALLGGHLRDQLHPDPHALALPRARRGPLRRDPHRPAGVLAQALVKVTGEMSRIPTRDLRAAEHFNAFYFAPALAPGVSLSSLFATHPTLQKRL